MMSAKNIFDQAKGPSPKELSDQFFEYLKVEKNSSQYTLINYEIDLRYWFKFIFDQAPGKFSLDKFTDFKLLRSYLADQGEKYSKTTVCHR